MKTIFMLATSGGGLGHLSRALAVAKQFRKKDAGEAYEVIFISTSPVVYIVGEQGFPYYYIPMQEKEPEYAKWVKDTTKRMVALVEKYRPEVVVYDAAFPLPWLVSCLKDMGIRKTVWIKRECYKPNMDGLNALEEGFGLVIMPKELNTSKEQDTEHKKYVAPIIQIEQQELYEREAVRSRFGAKKGEKLIYIQTGGSSDVVRDNMERVIGRLEDMEGIRLVIGGHILYGKRGEGAKKQSVCEYPVARSFLGMDLAVTAAGYNTVHELLACKVPALFIPNLLTVVDDQWKRAKMMEEAGYAICYEESLGLESNLKMALARRSVMVSALQGYAWTEGAREAADWIDKYVNQ